MPSIKGPALSLSAEGAIGRDITYAKHRGQAYAKSWSQPAQPHTPAQVAHRNVFKALQAPIAAAVNYMHAGLVIDATQRRTPFGNQLIQWNLTTFKTERSNRSMIASRGHPNSWTKPTLSLSASGDVVTLSLDDHGLVPIVGANGFEYYWQREFDPTLDPPPPIHYGLAFVYPFTTTQVIDDPGNEYVFWAIWFRGAVGPQQKNSASAVATVTLP